MSVVSKNTLIRNKLGLHARAATKLAQLAMQFDADVNLFQGEKSAPANSVMGLLMLESSQGKEVRIEAKGKDAQAALDAICQLIEDRFDESE